MKARKAKRLDPEGPLVENAGRILEVRLDELRALAPRALQEDHAAQQHDMRISAKRLRYVLEATGFCFGPEADRARRCARDLQEVLGELRDCDLMLPRIDAHADRLKAEDATALEPLTAHFQARRARLFERFVELWGELERERTWEQLEEVIERKLTSLA